MINLKLADSRQRLGPPRVGIAIAESDKATWPSGRFTSQLGTVCGILFSDEAAAEALDQLPFLPKEDRVKPYASLLKAQWSGLDKAGFEKHKSIIGALTLRMRDTFPDAFAFTSCVSSIQVNPQPPTRKPQADYPIRPRLA